MNETIQVRATQLGYYEHLRRYPGDVFTLAPRQTIIVRVESQTPEFDENKKPKTRILTAEDQFAPEWMERVEDEAERVTSSPDALRQENQRMLAERRGGRAK